DSEDHRRRRSGDGRLIRLTAAGCPRRAATRWATVWSSGRGPHREKPGGRRQAARRQAARRQAAPYPVVAPAVASRWMTATRPPALVLAPPRAARSLPGDCLARARPARSAP